MKISKIIKYFLVWRILLFVPVILAGIFLNLGSSVPFFEVNHYQILPDYLNYPILKAWANFDGVHYLNIAKDSYISGGRFFPLFPLIISFLTFGSSSFSFIFIVSLIIPNVFFIAALLLFVKLLKLDYPEKTSFQVVTYLLLFPVSFFFVSVYTESLFLLLTLGSFYLMRKGKWYEAALLAMFLSATRLVGIVIIPALIFEYLISQKHWNLRSWINAAFLSAISSLGIIAFSIYSYSRLGDYLHFLTAQGELNNGRSTSSFIFPLQTVYRYIKILTTLPVNLFEWWIALLEVSSFIFAAVLLFIAWRKKVRTSYLIFGALALLVPSLSGTFSGLPRYIIIIFPIFIALSLIKTKYLKIFYYVICPILLFLLLMFFTRAYFVA